MYSDVEKKYRVLFEFYCRTYFSVMSNKLLPYHIIYKDVKYRKSIEIVSKSTRYIGIEFIGDTDTLKLTRYPILRVLGIGFVPSLIFSTPKLTVRQRRPRNTFMLSDLYPGFSVDNTIIYV